VLVLTVVEPSLLSVTATIILVNWVGSARVLRAATLRIRGDLYFRAAIARGASGARILIEELLPNLAMLAVLLLGFSGAEALALEGSLAFIGAGPAPPMATWGTMLAAGLPYLASAWWIALAPALAIVGAVTLARLGSDQLQKSLFR
jgi:peptide/nickel transport system permease protein